MVKANGLIVRAWLLLLLLPALLPAQQVRLTLHRDSAGVVVLTQELVPVQTVCPVPPPAVAAVAADESVQRLMETQRGLAEELARLRTQLAEAQRASILERATPWTALAAAVGVIVTAVKK